MRTDNKVCAHVSSPNRGENQMTRQIIFDSREEDYDVSESCVLSRRTRKCNQENYEMAEGLRDEFVRDQ